MKKIKQTLISVCVGSLLANTAVLAQDVNLVSIPVPDHKIEQESLHFSQPITENSLSPFVSQRYVNASDEYWMEVSGKELNSGLALNISQPGALIRLSGKANLENKGLQAMSIDPETIELRKDAELLASPFSSKVTKEQLATANIFPNSSAVKLNKDVGKGTFQLRVTQSLNSEDRFMLNVKEKGSPYQLAYSAPAQALLANQEFTFDMSMNKSSKSLGGVTHNTFIKSPSGEVQAVAYQVSGDKYSITLPDSFSNDASASLGGLYELHIVSQARDANLNVNRNGKIAFAIAQPTARMTGEVNVGNEQALVGLDVASEGRYEISAIVSGLTKQGKSKQVMLSRSAHYLQPGLQNVQLKFDTAILEQANVIAPYKVSQLRLVDQSRMSLLEQQQQDLSKELPINSHM